jgi:hypothetical protein
MAQASADAMSIDMDKHENGKDDLATMEIIAKLQSLGFDNKSARNALHIFDGDIEAAANYLLTGQIFPPAALHQPNNATPTATVIQGPINQYSLENGRSACTCIALTAAAMFCANPHLGTINAGFLQHMIVAGVRTYEQFMVSSSGGDATSTRLHMRHMSAEDALSTNTGTAHDPMMHFETLAQVGFIRQGILSPSHDPNHARGLRSLLHSCYTDSCVQATAWTCVLMTKTPETVLLLLPPRNTTGGANTATTGVDKFVLIDSHPRPSALAFGCPKNAYARIHDSMDELIQGLQHIFPVTVLGPGGDELIALMYNSFDLYVFQQR